MLRSMTAFARWQGEHAGLQLTWELRSVNHRYLETSFRLPEELRPAEASLRERIAARVARGKLDVNLRLAPATADPATPEVDREALVRLKAACDQVAEVFDPARPDPLELLRWPGVLRTPSLDVAALTAEAGAGLDQALEALVANRAREGERIAAMLEERLVAIAAQVSALRAALPELQTAIRERIERKVAEVTGRADPDRLEQELALLLTKSDVAEELDRLDAHVAEAREVIAGEEPSGRRLDFLMQEFNREANTLGSKSQGLDQTRGAVELKVLVEQMREQVQNVE